ncbi:glycosyltransferase, partial [bacterium]
LLATDIGGNREIVFDGRNGFIVPAKDAQVLAQKLQYLFQHPLEREKMAQESHKTWEEKFSLKKMLQSIDSLYEKYIRTEEDADANKIL